MTKILIWDIETSLAIVTSFSLYPKYIPHDSILKDWKIMGAAWKWHGEKEVHSCFKSEKAICKELHKALSTAEILVHHNGDKFDLRKLKTKLLQHGLPPLPKIPTIDTLKVAKKEFGFMSNRLDYIGKVLGLGGKKSTSEGLWMRALQGDKKAIDEMEVYCKRDVDLLDQVYIKMRPHISNHPNINVFREDVLEGCTRCGCTVLTKYGYRYTSSGKKQRYKCSNCGAECGNKSNLTSTEIRT